MTAVPTLLDAARSSNPGALGAIGSIPQSSTYPRAMAARRGDTFVLLFTVACDSFKTVEAGATERVAAERSSRCEIQPMGKA
jgi:hypothetical protein